MVSGGGGISGGRAHDVNDWFSAPSMQVSPSAHTQQKGGAGMAERKIRVTPVRRAEIDVEKLVAGLMLLVEQLAREQQQTEDPGAEPAA